MTDAKRLREMIAALPGPPPFLLTSDYSAMFDAAGKEVDDPDTFPTVRAMVAALSALPAHLDQLDLDAERIRALEEALRELVEWADPNNDPPKKNAWQIVAEARALLEAKP